MSIPAIEFEGVSKSYVIRHQKTRYLKDRLTNALQRLNPFLRSESPTTIEDFWALRDLSFRIYAGESVGIIGPNGSGKSTTLKILAGVTQPTSGRVSVNGKLGALIEVGAGFHPELSGRENVFLNGSILGMKKSEIRTRFDEIVDFAELEKFIDTPVKHYSSGMYVRLGFSVAVHTNPEILLVDEVLAVGDLSFQKKCFDKMEQLKQGGRTFILISHSMEQIESLCERTIMLKDGRMVADGSPADVARIYIQQQGAKESEPVLANRGPRVLHSTGEVELLDIALLDQNGREVALIHQESFTVRIRLRVLQELSDVRVGFGIHTLDPIYIATHNSGSQLHIRTMNCGEHEMRCHVQDLPLISGPYSIRIGITGGTPPRTAFYAENLLQFRMAPDKCLPKTTDKEFLEISAVWSVTEGESKVEPLQEQIHFACEP
jgi:lipopolysaccharide transport system ATP-binding protein